MILHIETTIWIHMKERVLLTVHLSGAVIIPWLIMAHS